MNKEGRKSVKKRGIKKQKIKEVIGMDTPEKEKKQARHIQKYPRGTTVKVRKEGGGWTGVVQHTFRSEYGYGSAEDYRLLCLDEEGKPWNEMAWFEERELTLIDADTSKGNELFGEWALIMLAQEDED